jgi:hypothetical protein
MRKIIHWKQVVAVVALSVATAFCGSSSPTAPSVSGTGGGSGSGATPTPAPTPAPGGGGASTSCRIGPATYRIVTTSAAFTSTTNGSCTFNAATVEGTCTNVYTDSMGGSFTSVSTTKNASRGEVVDEVSVIPPLTLSSSTASSILPGGTVPASGGTATRTFSGRRVLTQTNTSTAGQTSVTTYTAWDSFDRPTAATVTPASGAPSQQSFSYDNASRTQTSSQSGVSCTQVFDQNGNPTVGTCPGSTSTFTMLSTQQICR